MTIVMTSRSATKLTVILFFITRPHVDTNTNQINPNYWLSLARTFVPEWFTRPSYHHPLINSNLCFDGNSWNTCPGTFEPERGRYQSAFPPNNVARKNFLRPLHQTIEKHAPMSPSLTGKLSIDLHAQHQTQQIVAAPFEEHTRSKVRENLSLNRTRSDNLFTRRTNARANVEGKPTVGFPNQFGYINFTPMLTTGPVINTTPKYYKDGFIDEFASSSHSTSVRFDRIKYLQRNFTQSLGQLERKLYKSTYNKLRLISPEDRHVNGISFVESGLFLHLALLALSTTVDPETRIEIDKCLGLSISDEEKFGYVNDTLSWLPRSNGELKIRWSFRLAVAPGMNISQEFIDKAFATFRLKFYRFNGTEEPDLLAKILNHMIELDSGGAMHDTFESEELSDGAEAVFLSTLYLRGRWRSAPTLLNGSLPFLDADDAPQRSVRMIRINDIMRYADIHEWDAEVLEVEYTTPGLSLLILVPKGRSLSPLADKVSATDLHLITRKMQTLRIAATLPLYTLRMTLLLPSKLRDMGINRLVDVSNKTDGLRLSHAIQRIMFWSEAGRNAFKDDGMEWDDPPELELVVNRPYVFFVRWRGVSLMSGHFVL